MRFESNTSVGLVGPSGHGKSTALALIIGFYDLNNTADEGNGGTLTVDGVDVRAWDKQCLRSHIAYVFQEPIVFSGTVAFNLRFGLSERARQVATDDELRRACENAGAWSFIEDLPDGLNQTLGDGGRQLSTGQKQRLNVAAASLRRSKILLLDEATSAQDSGNERLVQRAIESVSAGKTVISVAHRRAAIQNCTEIFVIKNGTVTERGSYDILTSNRGVFSELFT